MKESQLRRAVFNVGRLAGPVVGDEAEGLDLDPREQKYRAQLHRRFLQLASPTVPDGEMDSIFLELCRRRVDVEEVIAAFGEPEPEAIIVDANDGRAWPELPPSGSGGRVGQLLAAYRADEDVRKADHKARVTAARRGDLGVIWRKVKVKGGSYRVGFERSAHSHWRRAPRLLECGNPERAIRAVVRRNLAGIKPKLPRRLIDRIIVATLK
jgi:hypothetical protein